MNETAHQKNEFLKAIIKRTKIDTQFAYRSDELTKEKIQFIAEHCEHVLDIGKSSRDLFSLFKPGQATTLDINQFDGYPDIQDDICNPQHLPTSAYDGLICMAVLEHVYDPFSAMQNMYAALKDGGYCYVYVPFLYRYHAPSDLNYQDYFRYTRDGIAYLFRDFKDVTLYPHRGRLSTMLNLAGFWKFRVEKLFGQRINKAFDIAGSALMGKRGAELQASGYYIWAVK